jgi:prophage regulatory protein
MPATHRARRGKLESAAMVSESPIRLLRRKQLEEKIRLSRTAIYDRLNKKSASYDPDFPRPIELGTGKNPPVAWDEREVDIWIAKQIQRSRQAA